MKVGILGSGRMGRGLSELFERAGLHVQLGSRTPGKMPSTQALEQVAQSSDIVVLAIPHEAIESTLSVLQSIPDGTVVIDVANGVRVDDNRIRSSLDQPHGSWLASLLPHIDVARAFTHVHDELLVSRATRQPDTWAMAVAADSPNALETAATLVRAARYVPVPVGGLDQSSVLDPGGPLFAHLYLPGDLQDLLATPGAIPPPAAERLPYSTRSLRSRIG